MLRDVLAALLKRGLAKGTIDGAFASFSAMLTDAVDDELIEANPARGFRVKPTDPRLKPKLAPRDRRALPPAEVNSTSRTYAHATGEHREAVLTELERFVRMAGEAVQDAAA